jgi:hypothetical protein
MIQFDTLIGSALKAQNENPMSISETLSELRLCPVVVMAAVVAGLILSAAVAL